MGIGKYISKLKRDYIIKKVRKIRLPSFKDQPPVRRKLIFRGKVQGVGFRMEAYQLADRLNLTGWIKNHEDGSVETEIQGQEDKIQFLIGQMKSLKRAKVAQVISKEISLEEGEDFTIRR